MPGFPGISTTAFLHCVMSKFSAWIFEISEGMPFMFWNCLTIRAAILVFKTLNFVRSIFGSVRSYSDTDNMLIFNDLEIGEIFVALRKCFLACSHVSSRRNIVFQLVICNQCFCLYIYSHSAVTGYKEGWFRCIEISHQT